MFDSPAKSACLKTCPLDRLRAPFGCPTTLKLSCFSKLGVLPSMASRLISSMSKSISPGTKRRLPDRRTARHRSSRIPQSRHGRDSEQWIHVSLSEHHRQSRTGGYKERRLGLRSAHGGRHSWRRRVPAAPGHVGLPDGRRTVAGRKTAAGPRRSFDRHAGARQEDSLPARGTR